MEHQGRSIIAQMENECESWESIGPAYLDVVADRSRFLVSKPRALASCWICPSDMAASAPSFAGSSIVLGSARCQWQRVQRIRLANEMVIRCGFEF